MDTMVNKEKDLIGFAHKVISFRMNVLKACKAKGIAAPTDEQISEYINQYGLHFDDFMADFTEHEGMFRDPIHEFIAKVYEYSWSDEGKPTEDEMRAWTNANGYDVEKFLRERTIASYSPLERATLLATLEIGDVLLVKLWNHFIEESGIYGEDSYIYDLRNNEDIDFLKMHMDVDDKKEVIYQQTHNHARFIQWFNKTNNAINVKNDIKGVIIGYWGDIFGRVMGFPNLYGRIDADQIGMDYFFDWFWPVVREFNGYNFDERDGSLTKIENVNCKEG